MAVKCFMTLVLSLMFGGKAVAYPSNAPFHSQGTHTLTYFENV